MYWFAPGPVPTSETIGINFSHRSNEFAKLMFDLRSMLEFDLDKKVALIQGSASAAIESVAQALRLDSRRLLMVVNGTFSKRLYNTLAKISHPDVIDDASEAIGLIQTNSYSTVYVVQFETGDSKLNELEALSKVCKSYGTLLVVDSVSAYPYYKPPKEADVVILSSSKQLRGLPVMGIVAYSKGAERHFQDCGNYLSLVKAIKYGDEGQTQNTSLMPQIMSLWFSLKNKAWKPGVEAIAGNAATVAEGFEHLLIGESIAPVLTFKAAQPTLLVKWLDDHGLQVYYNPNYMTDRFQVSCYNYEALEPYEELNEALHEAAEGSLL